MSKQKGELDKKKPRNITAQIEKETKKKEKKMLTI